MEIDNSSGSKYTGIFLSIYNEAYWNLSFLDVRNILQSIFVRLLS